MPSPSRVMVGFGGSVAGTVALCVVFGTTGSPEFAGGCVSMVAFFALSLSVGGWTGGVDTAGLKGPGGGGGGRIEVGGMTGHARTERGSGASLEKREEDVSVLNPTAGGRVRDEESEAGQEEAVGGSMLMPEEVLDTRGSSLEDPGTRGPVEAAVARAWSLADCFAIRLALLAARIAASVSMGGKSWSEDTVRLVDMCLGLV